MYKIELTRLIISPTERTLRIMILWIQSWIWRINDRVVRSMLLEYLYSFNRNKCKYFHLTLVKYFQHRITLSTNLSCKSDTYFIRGESYSYWDLGYKQIPIEDHHSGRHSPEGSLIIYNSETCNSNSDTIDYLEYAPAMLKFFGINPPEYMLEPQFSF